MHQDNPANPPSPHAMPLLPTQRRNSPCATLTPRQNQHLTSVKSNISSKQIPSYNTLLAPLIVASGFLLPVLQTTGCCNLASSTFSAVELATTILEVLCACLLSFLVASRTSRVPTLLLLILKSIIFIFYQLNK